ncbi:hypothetical protein D3C81_1663920 [compost metagenome]
MLLQGVGVRADRQSLLAQPTLFVRCNDRKFAIAVLLCLDHGSAGVGDLLINLDDLSASGALLRLGSFERIDLRLVALGNFIGLLLQQADPLLGVTSLADHAGALRRFQLLVGVFVVGERFG